MISTKVNIFDMSFLRNCRQSNIFDWRQFCRIAGPHKLSLRQVRRKQFNLHPTNLSAVSKGCWQLNVKLQLYETAFTYELTANKSIIHAMWPVAGKQHITPIDCTHLNCLLRAGDCQSKSPRHWPRLQGAEMPGPKRSQSLPWKGACLARVC